MKNINRIARLPSSINPKTNVVAKVIAYNNVRYTLSDFPVKTIERKARDDSADDPVPLDVFKRMLAATPYTGGPAGLDDRNGDEGWLQFAMAAHEAARGDGADYLYAFIEWCQNDPNGRDSWSAESIQARWESFDCDEAVHHARFWDRLLLYFGQDDLVSDASQDTTAATLLFRRRILCCRHQSQGGSQGQAKPKRCRRTRTDQGGRTQRNHPRLRDARRDSEWLQ